MATKQGISSERGTDDQNHENEDALRQLSAKFASISFGVSHASAPDEASGIDKHDKSTPI